MSKQRSVATPTTGSAEGQAAEGVLATGCGEEQVRQLAYAHWQARGCPTGSPDEDWFRAEQELDGGAANAAAE